MALRVLDLTMDGNEGRADREGDIGADHGLINALERAPILQLALGVVGCATLAPRNFNPRDECGDGCAPGPLGGEDRAIEVL